MLRYNQCTKEELEYTYPADKYIEERAIFIYRAISIDASPTQIFPWITQLRFAPYSYDWIDNLGRRSPPYIIKDAPPLKTDTSIMFVFSIVDFEQNKSITLTLPQNSPLYLRLMLKAFAKSFYMTYQLFPQNNNSTRLAVKIVINSYDNIFHRWMVKIADIADYIMMRKQLLTFKKLAENQAHSLPHSKT